MYSMEDEHTPYFSKRIRMGDITSPKELVGLKDFTIELTYGNQDTKIIRSKEDVAAITEKDMWDELNEIFDRRDEFAKKHGFTFVDQVRKYKEPEI